VLLQCGELSGWLGEAQRISGAQEKAKDLIFEAMRLFKSERQTVGVSEAQYELGMCYFRLGSYDEARITLDNALDALKENEDVSLRAKVLIRYSIIEVWTGRYHDAWDILEKAEKFFETCADVLKGRWHGQKALVLQRLALTEKRMDYADRAIMEFTAAVYHLEQAKHERYCGSTLNNLAMLLYQIRRYSEAHEHLDRARRVMARLKDAGFLAQVDETRARVFIAEQKYLEANGVIAGVIQTLEKGGESPLLADALSAQGVVWARLGVHDKSMSILRRAIDTAEDVGALSNAGLAALALIEEHGAKRLNPTELYDAYRRTDRLLKGTQDTEEIARLRACARIVMRRLSGLQVHDRNFSLYGAMQEFEAKFIEEALQAEDGSVTRAAKLLGITHQSLAKMLRGRHKRLSHKRSPFKRRLRSVIKRGPKGLES
jgi:tetratricopeptide (TPR) repeat protein